MRNVLLCLLALGVAACGPTKRQGAGDDVDAPTGDPDGTGGGGGDANPAQTFVYAHTADTLYRVDPDTLAITMVGNFVWSNGSDAMTDIAIDKTGLMLGTSANAVYRIDTSNAHATRLTTGLTGGFNGLSFVPATALGQTGDDVLVATRNADGIVFRVDPMTGTTMQVGNMGSYTSSGDLVSVTGLGTMQTVNGSTNDRLVKLATGSFSATPIGASIGFSRIFGIAFWKDKIFGFTASGEFITINPTTGVGTLVQGNGPAWWGAAVTTSAPVIF